MTTPVPINALTGPYNQQTNGVCALGHPLNGMGRCQTLNDGVETPIVVTAIVGRLEGDDVR